jgi:hypothetical protein
MWGSGERASSCIQTHLLLSDWIVWNCQNFQKYKVPVVKKIFNIIFKKNFKIQTATEYRHWDSQNIPRLSWKRKVLDPVTDQIMSQRILAHILLVCFLIGLRKVEFLSCFICRTFVCSLPIRFFPARICFLFTSPPCVLRASTHLVIFILSCYCNSVTYKSWSSILYCFF